MKRFRMSKLTRCIGNDRANDCINTFKKIIEVSELQAVGAALYEPDWRKPDWGNDTTVRLQSPYQQALESALQLISIHSQGQFGSHSVSIVCCKDDKNSSIESIYNDKKMKDPRFQSLSITTSDRCVGLQCADLGAGLLRRSWKEIFDGDSQELFGCLPTGRHTRPATSFWSLRQGAVLQRAIFLAGETLSRGD